MSKSKSQELSATIGTYEIKARIEYRFDPHDPTHKYKCKVYLWLPVGANKNLNMLFINPLVLVCGDYLDQEWGDYDSSKQMARSMMQFTGYGWASVKATAEDYLAMCVRTVRGTYKRNCEAMDAMPQVTKETHLVA